MLTFSKLSRTSAARTAASRAAGGSRAVGSPAVSSRLAMPVFLSMAALLAGCGTVDRINSIGAIDYKSEAKQRQLPPLDPDAPRRRGRLPQPAHGFLGIE